MRDQVTLRWGPGQGALGSFVSQIEGKSTVGRILNTGETGRGGRSSWSDGWLWGSEVGGVDCFIGTYPHECKLHHLEWAASAGGFRLVEGDYHDVVIVIHGTS